MSSLVIMYECKSGFRCTWSGTNPDRTRDDVARCPECRGSVKSWVSDLALEQRTLERDKQQAMNTINAKRQALGEARREAREAQAHQKAAQVAYDAAERWHFPNSVEV